MKRTFIVVLVLILMSCNSSDKKQELSAVNISEEKTIKKTPELKQSMVRGEEIYRYFCVSCHLPNGKGVPKAFPPLADSDYLMTKRIESIKAVKLGQSGKIIVNGQTYNGAMPPLGLENDEIADVMNYITNSWDNTNDKLFTEEEVSEIEP